MKVSHRERVVKVHSFYIEEAELHGVEKAIILYNLRFWLEKNKANNKNLHDGYYWTYNSAKAFALLFPYFTASKIHRLLKQMEDDGLVVAGNYNKVAYDRTKWYSLPEFFVSDLDTDHFSEMENGSCTNEECDFAEMKNGLSKSATPIPDSKPNDKPVNKTDSKNASEGKKKSTRYKPVKPESVSEQVWNDLLILRKETKASNTKTAWTPIYSGLEKAQQATGHSLDQIITFWIGKAWKGFNADWYLNAQPKPQQTNYQGNNHANHQPANHSNQPKQSSADIYAAKLAEQRRQRDQAANAVATGCNRANVYDMETLV